MKLSELRDRLQDEFDSRETPIQWGTFMLGKVAQLEAENEALRKTYKKIQDADGPDVTMPIDMTLAMGEMTDLINRSKP